MERRAAGHPVACELELGWDFANIDFTLAVVRGVNDYCSEYSFATAGSAETIPSTFIENNRVAAVPVLNSAELGINKSALVIFSLVDDDSTEYSRLRMLRLFATPDGLLVEQGDEFHLLPKALTLDAVFTSENPAALLHSALETAERPEAPPGDEELLAPLQSQEVWAAGVTYLRSRTARMAESKEAGGGTFYDKVYDAERPELFFKATSHRVAAPGRPVRIRADARWSVPEPELTLAINRAGRIFGYTIGNDMSSRDIEGENPLYLPQAKVYDRSAALGPCLVVSDELPPPETVIRLEIWRSDTAVFSGETSVAQIKRPLPSLAEWLFRENCFPHGCLLMTGTGIVPPDNFTLRHGDEIRITIEPVGTLINPVA